MLPELIHMNALRVFMTTDTLSETWHYALDLARGLRAYDTDTALCVLGPVPSPEQQAAARRIPGLKLICLDLPLGWAAVSPKAVLKAAEAVAQVAHDEGCGIVHLNSPVLAASGHYPAPVVSVCHSCTATWWEATRTGPLPRDQCWHAELFGQGLMRSNAVIAPTKAFARCISQTYKLRTPPAVVYNGRRPSMREALPEGTIPAAPFALTAGRLWDDGKNLAVLDAAAGRLDLPVFAAGPRKGPKGAGTAFNHIRWLGILSDGQLAEWLAAKPIFVSTSLYEPFGPAILEAAEAGCPLVLSDIPTLRELWEGAAEFVPARDEQQVAEAVERIACDPSRRAALASAARRRARRYTAEVMSAKVRAIYGRLLGSQKSVRSAKVAAA
jgi:glycosyltransferase involved in cell wall biosynthesis